MRNKVIILLVGILLVSAATDVQAQRRTRRQPPRYNSGSFINTGAGVGISQLNYDLIGGTNTIRMHYNAAIGYSYFFNNWCGIGTGLQFSTYGSRCHLDEDLIFYDAVDADGDSYQHHVSFNNWQETQITYLLEVPIAMQFKYKPNTSMNKAGEVGVYGTAGIKLGFPIYANYKNISGDVTHTGYYPEWDVTMHDLPGRFSTSYFTDPVDGKISSFSKINFIGYAEIGTLIQVGYRTDLMLGVYANYGFNNLYKYKQEDKQPLGFATDENGLKDVMPEYKGLIGTTQTSAIHPWSVGIRLGLQICLSKSDQQKAAIAKQKAKEEAAQRKAEKEAKIKREFIYVHDTVFVNVPGDCPSPDTVYICPEDLKKEQFLNLLQHSVIYFELDDYKPIVEPEYILDSIAYYLCENRHWKVHVNGHACKLGSDAYNQVLAQKRAEAVAALLRKKGVNENQLKVASYGATHPFTYNGEHQLSKDRRVEIIFVDD